jgi:mono/diheme cytochrome c family protein
MIHLFAVAQESIALILAAAIAVAWLAYVIATAGRRDDTAPPGSEIELAPNRKPYYNDEALEGPRLERVLGWALVLLIISSLGPLVYWLNEPSRQAGAIEEFDRKARNRGFELFQPTDAPGGHNIGHFGCAECHGNVGQGGVAEYTITDYLGRTRKVTWVAPALDTALLKFDEEELETILIYGRANTPMPAWGVEGGGPMNDQQITDLVAYIKSIQLTGDEIRERAREEATLSARKLGTGINDGATLFDAHCARCHTQGHSYGEPDVQGGGAFGPNITGGTAIRQFPDIEDMIEFLSTGTEFGQPYGVRGMGSEEGGGMPGFGRILSQEQIRAIAEYVRGL